MSTLKLGESTSTLEIFPGTSTFDNEIQKYVQIRDFGNYWHFLFYFFQVSINITNHLAHPFLHCTVGAN